MNRYTERKERNKTRQGQLMLLLLLTAALLAGCSHKTEEIDAFRDKGIALYKEGNYEAAIEEFKQAMDASYGRVTETQTDILCYLAEGELRTGDYENAVASYKALAELEDTEEGHEKYESLMQEMDALEELAKARDLIAQGDYAAALEIAAPLASLDAGTESGRIAWFDQAVCAEYERDFEKACSLLEAYCRKYPEDEAAAKEYRFCASRREEMSGQ